MNHMKRFLLYLSISALATAIYWFGITNTFLADDWPVISRYANLSWDEAMTLFVTVSAGWYRPVFYLFLSLCWQLFEGAALGFHIVIMALYVIVTALVGHLSELLTKSRPIGLLTVVIFGIHGVHAEPVLWIASSNELLAGLFVVASMSSYVLYRQSPTKLLWMVGTILFFLLALASKETAVFLPIMFVIYDLLFGVLADKRRRMQNLILPLLMLGVSLGFVFFRLTTGSPYSTSVPLTRIVINGVYYVAVELFMLPENYGYLTALPLWRASPLLPAATVGVALIALGGAAWLLFKHDRRLARLRQDRGLLFLVAWSMVALGPVILTATGRTAFMSSMGVSGALAIVWATLWKAGSTSQSVPTQRRWTMVFLALFLGSTLTVTAYRAYWWQQAGIVMENTLASLQTELSDIPEGSNVCVLDLPDHLHHAYVFRNAFPAISSQLFPNWTFEVILDNAPPEVKSAACQDEDSVVLQYEELGTLTRQ